MFIQQKEVAGGRISRQALQERITRPESLKYAEELDIFNLYATQNSDVNHDQTLGNIITPRLAFKVAERTFQRLLQA